MPELNPPPTLAELLDSIPPLDPLARQRACARLDRLTKPPGSLGKLEHLVADLAAMTGQALPRVDPPAVIVFAADHGVAAEGVSAFPASVTAQMVANFAQGGAAINVFARRLKARLEVVDVGVSTSCAGVAGVVVDRVRSGTGNIAREDAMSQDDVQAALNVGVRAAQRATDQGAGCLILGEMGIANTTASSALLAAFTGLSVDAVTGRGTVSTINVYAISVRSSAGRWPVEPGARHWIPWRGSVGLRLWPWREPACPLRPVAPRCW